MNFGRLFDQLAAPQFIAIICPLAGTLQRPVPSRHFHSLRAADVWHPVASALPVQLSKNALLDAVEKRVARRLRPSCVGAPDVFRGGLLLQ